MRGSALLFLVVGALLAGGGARLAWLEVTRGPELRQKAERQQRATRVIPARRGEILDTRGCVLAGTVRRPSIYVDPHELRDLRFAAYSVGPLLGLDPEELERRLTQWHAAGSRFEWLKRRVSDDELAAVQSVIRSRRLGGIKVEFEPQRKYPQERLAPHVVGFVGVDAQGLTGIELAYDAMLRGTPGQWAATVDTHRRRVRAREDEFSPAVDGATVILTLDSYLQQCTQEILRKAAEKHAPEWAVAVVMDPQSGEVLAMASWPDFDPSDPLPRGFLTMTVGQRERAKEIWRNRAVSDSYEPGSVFKPFIASQAMDEGVVRIDEVFRIDGPVHDFGRRQIRDTHAYGSLALHEVISKSSNIGMGLVGARCGKERLYRYVRMMGFGDVTGIGLPIEHAGQVRPLEDWNPSFSLQSIPIGQEIAVTPIQLVAAFSTFCNGGVLLRPRIVRGVIGPDGSMLEDDSRPIPIRRVLSEQTSELFRRQALVETVVSGTAQVAALPEYQVFGKTGTAQIASGRGGGYEGGQYVGSFIGGAPADHPRAVALVSIYKPSKEGYYGSVVAAPSVREILRETLAYMQVPPELEPPPRGAARAATDGKRTDDASRD